MREATPLRITFEAAIAQLQGCGPGSLIAVDGLPCSGKSTLAERLQELTGMERIGIDEFMLPEKDWPAGNKPAFPFEYMRYVAFVSAVKSLAKDGTCSFHPFDWGTLSISQEPRTVTRLKPVIIEGVSSLNPTLCDLYDIRVFVDSDRTTALQCAIDRGLGHWQTQWRELFMPSADLYMLTEPLTRAHITVAGRGASELEQRSHNKTMQPTCEDARG